MKRIILLFTITHYILNAHAQTITNYGTSSGTTGVHVSYFGYRAGRVSAAGTTESSFFGSNSGRSNIGSNNTGLGAYSLAANTTGTLNTATGTESLQSCTTGTGNVANGYQSLSALKNGVQNTAIGLQTSAKKTAGDDNVAVGAFSQGGNTGGSYNSSVGSGSLYYITNDLNTAVGYNAMFYSVYATENCSVGAYAAYQTEGVGNTAVGNSALYNNTDGQYNTAIGYESGPNASNLTNTTAIGYGAVPTISNSIVLGNPSISKIGGYMNWSVLSDGRFKKDVQEDITGLDFINKLRPVSYTVDNEAVSKLIGAHKNGAAKGAQGRTTPVRQMGFIAQEVEEIIEKNGYVFSGINKPQNENDHYSLSYAEFVMPLVKAVQELSRKDEEQQKRIEAQQKKIDLLLNQLNSKTSSGIENEVVLFQNAPNPFSVDTEISMTLPERANQVHLMVYALDGKELKSIEVTTRGKAIVKIAANDLSAGMYIYALIVDNDVVDSKRMILTK